MPVQCGKELGLSDDAATDSYDEGDREGWQAISRPKNGVQSNPFNSMAPASVRKPLVTLFSDPV
jgi:hypothetical protein